MTSWTATAAVSGVNFEMSAAEVFRGLRSRSELARMLREAAAEKLMSEASRKSGISISDEDLQAAANRFRLARGLHSAEDTHRWLRRRGWSLDDFEDAVAHELRVEKFQMHIPDAAIKAAFEVRRAEYDRVRLRQILVASAGIAQELLARLREGESRFEELAREFSIDAVTRYAGGDLGLVERRALGKSVAERLFSVVPVALVGPVVTGQGVAIYRVDEIVNSRLDAAVEKSLRARLCRRWLANELRARQLTFPLLDALTGHTP